MRWDGTIFAPRSIFFTSMPPRRLCASAQNMYMICNVFLVCVVKNAHLYTERVVCAQTDVHGSVQPAYLARNHSQVLRPCLHWVTITPFILLLPSPMFWFLLKVLCQCPPSRVPLPCMLIDLCIFYYCCQGKIRDTFSKGALRGQWTQRGVLLLLHYQSSSHLNGASLWAFSSLSLSLSLQ